MGHERCGLPIGATAQACLQTARPTRGPLIRALPSATRPLVRPRLSRADYSRIVRVVALVIEVAVVVLVAYLVYGAVAGLGRRRRPGLPTGGRWQAHHYAENGHTVVSVARLSPAGEVTEEHVVARIPDSDDDWSRKFVAAKQEAEERAFHLNADSD